MSGSTVELSPAQQVSMNLFPSNALKAACADSQCSTQDVLKPLEEVLTPRSQCGSTCDGSVDGTDTQGAAQSSTGPFSRITTVDTSVSQVSHTSHEPVLARTQVSLARTQVSLARTQMSLAQELSLRPGMFSFSSPSQDDAAATVGAATVDDGFKPLTLSRSTGLHNDAVRQIVRNFGAADDQTALSPKTGVHSGDGYDPRWLEWEGAAEFAENFGVSGDGSVANVGLNLSGSFCCPLCSQQFSEQNSLNLHTKFTHQVEEPNEEWLSFPSA